jgi:opacity protein-like surface antigen
MMRKSLLVLAVSAVLTLAAGAAPGSGQQQANAITVQEFAVMVSQAMGGVATPDRAVAGLRARGVDLGVNMEARLTEERVVAILGDLGYRARTGNPGQGVTSEKAASLLSVADLGTLTANVMPAQDPVEQCLDVKNRGRCQECCKEVNGCGLHGPCEFAKGCAVFCKRVPPPGQASPGEPLPD